MANTLCQLLVPGLHSQLVLLTFLVCCHCSCRRRSNALCGVSFVVVGGNGESENEQPFWDFAELLGWAYQGKLCKKCSCHDQHLETGYHVLDMYICFTSCQMIADTSLCLMLQLTVLLCTVVVLPRVLTLHC